MQMATILVALVCVLQQPESEPPKLHVSNETRRIVEFWIRASDRDRDWTKIRLNPGEYEHIDLLSQDPFDIEIWRHDGGRRWVLDQQVRVPLKAALAKQDQWSALTVRRSRADPAYPTSSPSQSKPVYVYNDLGAGSLSLHSSGGEILIPIESIGGYGAMRPPDHAPPYPPVPKPRKPQKN